LQSPVKNQSEQAKQLTFKSASNEVASDSIGFNWNRINFQRSIKIFPEVLENFTGTK